MAILSPEDVETRLADLPGWRREGDGIRKQFTFGSFPDAVAFVVRLSFAAEAADHHPDILVSYRRVTLTWSTHSEGGITQKDIDGAAAAERLARASSRP